MTLPKQITKNIKQYRATNLHQLYMKDIYWTLTTNPHGSVQARTKHIQLRDMYLIVSYANGNKKIEAIFSNGVKIIFDSEYFENYSDIKFVSLVYFILDEFGPILNPEAYETIIQIRNRNRYYQNFPYRNVYRLSLKTDPVYKSFMFMKKTIPKDE